MYDTHNILCMGLMAYIIYIHHGYSSNFDKYPTRFIVAIMFASVAQRAIF